MQSLYVFSENTNIYKYSGYDLEPILNNCLTLQEIKLKVEEITKLSFNTALINFYRNGNDNVGWHSDDESLLTNEICSVSFGETRKFQLRCKSDLKQKVNLKLSDGDVLLMSGETQKFWQHGIPKEPKIKNGRINITFRNVKT